MTLRLSAPQCAAAIGLLALSATWAQAQAPAWPQKAVKLLAPSTPGGPPDVYARALADHLSKARAHEHDIRVRPLAAA